MTRTPSAVSTLVEVRSAVSRNRALEHHFVTQVASRFNALAAPPREGTRDCLVASGLMSAWLTGRGARPSTPAGIRDAVSAARAVATGEVGSTRALELHEGRALLDSLGAPSTIAPRLNDALTAVRSGDQAIVVVDMGHVWPDTNPWTRHSYHARSAELGIDHWPGPHAIVVTDWHPPSATYGVLDPMACNGPFRATATELAYSNVQWATLPHPAGLIVHGA